MARNLSCRLPRRTDLTCIAGKKWNAVTTTFHHFWSLLDWSLYYLITGLMSVYHFPHSEWTLEYRRHQAIHVADEGDGGIGMAVLVFAQIHTVRQVETRDLKYGKNHL